MSLGDKIKEYFAPSPDGVRVRDVVRELPGGIATVGQGSLRMAAPVVTGLGRMSQKVQAAMDPFHTYEDYRKKFSWDDITPTTTFEKNLFGTDKTLSFANAGASFGLDEKSAIAPVVGALFGAAELVPGGTAVKNQLNLAKESVDIILKSRNVNRIKQILVASGRINATDAETAAKVLKDVNTEAGFTKVVNGLKERGFITSTKNILPEGASPKLGGLYATRSTDDLAVAARNLVADDIDVATDLAKTGTDERAVAVASELIKKYTDDAARATNKADADALYDRVADIANTIAPKLTELGRAVQAASILARVTPEGQIRFAAKTIQSWNRANPTRKIPELTGQQTKDLTEEAKRIFAMPDGDDKAMAYQKLQENIQSLVPTPMLKKIMTVWKAGLLTGIKTTGLNLFSNTAHFGLEMIKDVPAAAVDSVAALFTGKRTTAATIRGLAKGVKEGFEKGKRYFKTGYDSRDIGEKLDYKKISFGKGKVAEAFQKYTETVFRTIGAQDQPFYYGALSRSLHDQALAQAKTLGLRGQKAVDYAEELVSNPTEEMITAGVVDATTAVFQNKTALGEIGQSFKRIPESPGVQKIIGDRLAGSTEIVMPFVRTPSSVAMQIINYSPVGFVKTLVSNIGKGKFNQRAFSQGMGRAITGTVPMYIGYKLAENGLVSYGYPETESERAIWEAEGRKDNSIKINGKWVEPTVLGPAGNLLLLGAYFERGAKADASPSLAMFKGLKEAATGGFAAFKEQTFLTGINSFIEAFDDPERYMESYLSGLAASAVPTIVSDVAKATDPYERRTDGVVDRVAARLPGARNATLEPKVDVLGRKIESYGTSLDILINPMRPQEDRSTPVTNELRRLKDLGLNAMPTKLGNKNGLTSLSPEQNTWIWEETGRILNAKLTGLMAMPAYQKADDSERAKAIKRITEEVRVLTRAAFVADQTAGLTGDALKAKLAELARDKELLNQDVYREYLRIR